MQHITSRQNAIVARYRAARDRKADGDPVLLDGVHLVREALDSGLALRDVVAAAGAIERSEIADLLARLSRAGVDVRTAAPAVMSALSPVRSASSIVALTDAPGVLADAQLHRLFDHAGPGHPLVAIGYSVQDPGNVGAIIRVVEAAGGTGVVVGTQSADPLSWKAVRASMGSALRLPLGRDTGAGIQAARTRGCRIVALSPRGGRSLFELDLRKPTAIVVGGEGAGIPIGLLNDADDCATIPMRSPVESLNAALTAAIALYEAHRQRSA